MVSNTDLAANNTVFSDHNTASDTRLCKNDNIIFDHHIMGNMAQIIDPDIIANNRIIQPTSVNSRASPDIASLADYNPPQMRQKLRSLK